MIGHYLTLSRYYQLGAASPRALGDYYRPNQAYDRGVFRGRTDLVPHLGQLPDLSQPVSVQPNLLLWGGLAALAAVWLWGAKSGPELKKRRLARMAAQRSRLSERIKELEE